MTQTCSPNSCGAREITIILWHAISTHIKEISCIIAPVGSRSTSDPQTRWSEITQITISARSNWSKRRHAVAIENSELETTLAALHEALTLLHAVLLSRDPRYVLKPLDDVLGAALALHVALKDIRRSRLGLCGVTVAPPVPLRTQCALGVDG